MGQSLLTFDSVKCGFWIDAAVTCSVVTHLWKYRKEFIFMALKKASESVILHGDNLTGEVKKVMMSRSRSDLSTKGSMNHGEENLKYSYHIMMKQRRGNFRTGFKLPHPSGRWRIQLGELIHLWSGEDFSWNSRLGWENFTRHNGREVEATSLWAGFQGGTAALLHYGLKWHVRRKEQGQSGCLKNTKQLSKEYGRAQLRWQMNMGEKYTRSRTLKRTEGQSWM